MKATILLCAFLIVGSLAGSAAGFYLALPRVCLTADNFTSYTAECRAAIRGQR